MKITRKLNGQWWRTLVQRVGGLLGVLGMMTVVQAEDPVSFRAQIAPVLINNCLACHGPKKAEGGYRVDNYERLLSEGDSGSVGVKGKDIEASELFRRLVSEDKDERMPLESEPLTAEEIALVKRWITEGAANDAADPKAPLSTIVPPPVHPDPPEAYPSSLPITALVFSPDGKELLVGGYHELTVWNPQDGKLVRRIKNISQRTYAVRYSPDGKQLAVGGGAPGRLGEARLFNMENGELIRVLGTTTDVVLDVAFNPKGDQLAIASAAGVIRIFEVATGKEIRVITSHSDWVMAIAWSDDGKQIVSASRDKTAKVFDAEKGELVVTYSGHGQPVRGVAFHPEGKEVFSSGNDKKIHRWKVADGKKSAEVGFGGEVYKLQRAGEFFVTASADKTVRQFEAKTHKAIRSYAGNADWALATAFHTDSKRIASGGFDGEVHVWNAEDGKPVVKFVAAPGYQASK
ncbi:MAG: c-type cytochrome domain-containing protein [Planctomycetota bacterium]|nr:c-type cytochrome domain-containing protein [Planctomycetota bacterium]